MVVQSFQLKSNCNRFRRPIRPSSTAKRDVQENANYSVIGGVTCMIIRSKDINRLLRSRTASG